MQGFFENSNTNYTKNKKFIENNDNTILPLFLFSTITKTKTQQ
jgi:hypothetical protein